MLERESISVTGTNIHHILGEPSIWWKKCVESDNVLKSGYLGAVTGLQMAKRTYIYPEIY